MIKYQLNNRFEKVALWKTIFAYGKMSAVEDSPLGAILLEMTNSIYRSRSQKLRKYQ